MRHIFLLAGVMMMVGVAHAEIYQWTDKGGIVHFTDNPDKIPPAYRSRAKEVDVTPTIQETGQLNQTQPTTDEKIGPTYGGHDELWWRSSFMGLREKIQVIQGEIGGNKEDLTEIRRKRTIYQKPSDRVAFHELDDKIKKQEEQVKDLQKQLADLDAEANRSGVPQGWRGN